MQNNTQSVQRALSLLKVFDRATPALGITELAARVGLHKSTAYRLAATLAGEGFLRQDPDTGRYSLGESLYRVAAGLVEQDPLLREGRRALAALRDACGHMVSLAVLDDEQALFVLVEEATLPVRAAAMKAGDRLPLSVSAAGKVLLADLPPAEADALLRRQGMPRMTPKSLASRQALARELARVRRDGIGWGREESAIGLLALAGPVRRAGRTVAALGVACPTNLTDARSLDALAHRVRAAADELSHRLHD
jgi:DNA-binding IclR family transcriptional regulator